MGYDFIFVDGVKVTTVIRTQITIKIPNWTVYDTLDTNTDTGCVSADGVLSDLIRTSKSTVTRQSRADM